MVVSQVLWDLTVLRNSSTAIHLDNYVVLDYYSVGRPCGRSDCR